MKRLIHHFSTFNVPYLTTVVVMYDYTLTSIYLYVHVSMTKLVKKKKYLLKLYHGGNDCELIDHSVKVHRDLHLHFWLLDKNKRCFSLSVFSPSVPQSVYFLKREGLGSAPKKRVFIGHSYSALPLIFPIFRLAGNFICVMRVLSACLELN